METDKALVEVPSPWTGTVSELCGSAGDMFKVGAVLVRYGDGGSATTADAEDSATAPEPAAEEAGDEDAGTVVGSVSPERPNRTPDRTRPGARRSPRPRCDASHANWVWTST